jgi:tetratricopeptide (TPR) repeat protein
MTQDAPLPPPDFDPNGVLATFIAGVAQIFYGEPGASQPAAPRPPEQLKLEVQALLLDMFPDAPEPPEDLTPEEWAAETAYVAWERFSAGEPLAEEAAILALRIDPNTADAYSLLGVSAGDQLELAMPLFTLAVMAGADKLGPDGFERYQGQFWKAEETRPFMGALAFLARANRDAGAYDPAVAHLVELLNLNPPDDQGARYDLVAIALETGRLETAEKIFEAYRDDDTATFAYAKALYAFQRGGDNDPARLALRAARAANPHVIDYLIGLKQPPEEVTEEGLTVGGEMEATLILEMLGRAWMSWNGAVDWLKKQTVVAAPAAPAKAKRSGPREV